MTEPATDSEVERDAPASSASPRSTLRAKRERLRREREPLALPFPGYGDSLIAKYRPLDITTEVKPISERMEKMERAHDDQAEIKGCCDILIKACVGLYEKVDGQLVPLEESLGGDGPIGLNDKRLAADLGLQGEPNGRQIVREGIFAERDDLLILHYQELDRWMTSANVEDDQDF